MQDRPDAATLLDAVARFLAEQARPAIADPAVTFRVQIAAHLARMVADEIRGEAARDAAQIARLRALLPDADARDVASLERELARRIRDGAMSDADMPRVVEHVRMSLREKLAVVNPRFDLADEIE